MASKDTQKTPNVKAAVLMGYAAGTATSVPPLSEVWTPLSRIPELLIYWVWSALSSASEWLPVDELGQNAPDVPVSPKHQLALGCLIVASFAPGVVSLLMRSVVDEGAYLQSLGQSVAWIIVPASILSFLFVPAKIAILLVLTVLAVSVIIVIKPANQAERAMWLLQGVMSVQTIVFLLRGPSQEFVEKVQNYIESSGTISVNEASIELPAQMWIILIGIAGLLCLAVIRQAWAVMKPPTKQKSSGW